jgi:hypothetical protein
LHAQAAPHFVDVTRSSGLHYVHTAERSGNYHLPEIMGAGVAWFDYDNDGDLDLYFAGSPPRGAALFRRNADGRYEEITATAGLVSQGQGMGVALGDIDNDGDLDLFLTRVHRDRLMRNNGDGTFTDTSLDAGFTAAGWSSSAAFCDIDTDGYLDLFVARYVVPDTHQRCSTEGGTPDYCPPNVYPSLPDRLYQNRGDGTFTDISTESGIGALSAPALGALCHDLNQDGHADIFVANDGTANHLWINDGEGGFTDQGVRRGVATNLFGEAEAGMGIAVGDVNHDEVLDLFLTHIDRESNTLYVSVGAQARAMADATIASGLGPPGMPFTGFGTAFLDIEHDGDLDLVIANGRVRRPARESVAQSPLTFPQIYGEQNLIMENSGRAHFTVRCEGDDFCRNVGISRGLTTADFDADGDLDLVVANAHGAARLYANVTRATGNWLRVRAVDGHRDAIGATISMLSTGRTQIRPVTHSASYLSSREAAVHFGLGSAPSVEAIVVMWPGGQIEQFEAAGINRQVSVRRGLGETAGSE